MDAEELDINWAKWNARDERDNAVMSETLGRLCEQLGLDCSCCYDAADLVSLIVSAFEEDKP